MTATVQQSNAATLRRINKTKVNGAIPHIEVKQTVDHNINGKSATAEEFAAFLKANAPAHPWLGLLAQLGTMCVGWSATMIACTTALGFITAGTTSMWLMGLGLAVYFLIGCIGIILSMRLSSQAGNYMELHGFDQVTTTVRGWFARTPATQGA